MNKYGIGDVFVADAIDDVGDYVDESNMSIQHKKVTMDKKIKKVSTSQEYIFKAKHIKMILSEEVELSREYPIAVMNIRGNDSIILYHKSLYLKAKVLKLTLPDSRVTYTSDFGILCKTGKEVGDVMTKLKAVLTAPWDCKGVEVHVKMIGVG